MARPFKSFAHEAPHDLVKRIPIGSKIVRKNGRSGGPWIARTPFGPGVKSRKIYVGSDSNKALIERAWAIVGTELAELEATPDGRKLRALEAIAGGPALARTAANVVEVPILESPQQLLSFAAGGRAGARRRPKR